MQNRGAIATGFQAAEDLTSAGQLTESNRFPTLKAGRYRSRFCIP
jgi:hypothetical protein